VLLAIAEWFVRQRPNSGRPLEQIRWRDAIVVGLSQAAALVPGVSRSGSTLLGGLSSGLSREAAARYSFLLSVPAVFAAGMYKLLKEKDALLRDSSQVLNLTAGLIAAAIVGYLAIDWLLKFLRKRSTMLFVVYRIFLAVILLAMLRNGAIVDSTEPAVTAARADHHSRAE
jgi:undecaprenyl-diphosphatase